MSSPSVTSPPRPPAVPPLAARAASGSDSAGLPAHIPPAHAKVKPWASILPRYPLVWLSAFLIACGWDRAVWIFISRQTMPIAERLESLGIGNALGRLFSGSVVEMAEGLRFFAYFAVKLSGTVWVAALIAAIMVLRPVLQPDTRLVKRGLRRGTLVFLCPAAAGLLAETLKLLIKRERPEYHDGRYAFRLGDWLTDPLNASGLGLPSSHAAAAVGLAVALSIVWPRYTLAWVLLGATCCLSRVLAGAHFGSDVLLGVLVGLIAARSVAWLDLRNNQGAPVPA